MFPITYRHQFNYTVQGDERWIAGMLRMQIVRSLVKVGARNVTNADNRIRFSGKIWSWSFHLTKWDFYFNMISKGEVAVDCCDNCLNVAYQISFIDYFAWLLGIMGFWILALFVFANVPLAQAWPIWGLFFLLLAWLGGNVSLTYYLFNRFMKSCLREFFNSASTLGVQGKLITSR